MKENLKESLKENYKKVELEVIVFEGRDIVTTSDPELPDVPNS